MNILFTTAHRETVSTVFNAHRFRRMAEGADGVRVDLFGSDYRGYDVILFMAYDADIRNARAQNPSARIGLVDIRSVPGPEDQEADFIVVNGLEMMDLAAEWFSNVFVLPIFPDLAAPDPSARAPNERLTLCYHGNKVHFQELLPVVTSAIEAVADERDIDLVGIYDVERLGRCEVPLSTHPRVRTRYEQWTPDVYERVVAGADIGLVPNLVPLPRAAAAKAALSFAPGIYSEYETDILLRYKFSSNPGRLLVFAQLGVPVVADFTPSSVNLIQHGRNGMLAHSAAGWYRALKTLADDPGARRSMGEAMRETFAREFAPDRLRDSFLSFLAGLPPNCPAPKTVRDLRAGFERVGRAAAPANHGKRHLSSFLSRLCPPQKTRRQPK